MSAIATLIQNFIGTPPTLCFASFPNSEKERQREPYVRAAMARGLQVDDEIHELFRRNVRRIMERRGLNAMHLADFSGIGRGRISDLLSGEGSPTLRTMKRLADALGVGVVDLLSEPGQK